MNKPGPVHATLIHMCTLVEWLACREQGRRLPPDYDDIGFVHLSSPEQVHIPANLFYTGRRDLVALVLDPDRLGSPVVWESPPGDPTGIAFPHLYGPLPAAAVISVVEYRPGADGVFAPFDP